MIDTDTEKGRLVATAMKLAAARPWRDISLRGIAEEAGVSLAVVRVHFDSKTAILAAFSRAADEVVLRQAAGRQEGIGPRDAIFEVVMSRFDAMEPYKSALRSIVRGAGRENPDPGMLRAILASQRWMLEAAGIDTSGAGGAVRTLGLASVYASVFHTWLDDDDPGLARTMAALDRRLRRGEQNLRALEDVCGVFGRIAGVFRRRPQQRGPAASGEPAREPRDIGPAPGPAPEPPSAT
ncbi:MAG: TetR family transcriptional regulator [Hyphomicrobiaceae bacterium]